jgi:prepilin-type processing-associated H-X9-DG protein
MRHRRALDDGSLAANNQNARNFAQVGQVKNSSERVLFADTGHVTKTDRGYSMVPQDQPSMGNVSFTETYAQGLTLPDGNAKHMALRHNNGANILFADGHVERWGHDEVVESYRRQFVGGASWGKWLIYNKDMKLEWGGPTAP